MHKACPTKRKEKWNSNAEVYKLLDADKLDEAAQKLEAFSEEEIKLLLLEALMMERVVKAKIKLLKQDLAFWTLRFKRY